MGSIPFPNKPEVEAQILAWNLQHPVGTKVVMHGFRGDRHTHTTCEAFINANHFAAVCLAGLPGNWQLSSLHPE